MISTPPSHLLQGTSLPAFPALVKAFSSFIMDIIRQFREATSIISDSLQSSPEHAAHSLAALPAFSDLLFTHALILKLVTPSMLPTLVSEVLPLTWQLADVLGAVLTNTVERDKIATWAASESTLIFN